jgi:hypothetical protein
MNILSVDSQRIAGYRTRLAALGVSLIVVRDEHKATRR